jgi:hypothetical protein
LLGAIEPIAGFEHADFRAGERQYVGRDSSSRSRTHDYDVIRFGFRYCLCHMSDYLHHATTRCTKPYLRPFFTNRFTET